MEPLKVFFRSETWLSSQRFLWICQQHILLHHQERRLEVRLLLRFLIGDR